jgi:hypothetical protein
MLWGRRLGRLRNRNGENQAICLPCWRYSPPKVESAFDFLIRGHMPLPVVEEDIARGRSCGVLDLPWPSRYARDAMTTSRNSAATRLGSSERPIRIIQDYRTLTLPLTSSQTRKECSAVHDAGDECHHPLHEAGSPFSDPGVISAKYRPIPSCNRFVCRRVV